MTPLSTIVGALIGLVIAGGTAGIIVGSLVGENVFSFIGAFVGFAASYPIVRLLMHFEAARPALRWLYPYDRWTGDEGAS